MFTTTEIWTFIIALIGLALTVLNIIDKAIVLRQKAKEPHDELEKRIDALEEWSKGVEMQLKDGTEHFARVDEGNKVTQKALLALIDDALSDSDNHDELKRARENLYEYLSKK